MADANDWQTVEHPGITDWQDAAGTPNATSPQQAIAALRAGDTLGGKGSAINEGWSALHDIWNGGDKEAKAAGFNRLMGAVGTATAPLAAIGALLNPVAAIGATGGGLLGGMGARRAASGLDAGPNMQEAAGNVGSLLGSAPGAALATSAVPLLGKAANGLAESAMGVRPKDRAFGKTPGAAILNETSGFSPEAVGNSARDTLNTLNPQLDALAAQATKPTSLQGALDIIDQEIAKAKFQNAPTTVSQLQAMRQSLTTNANNGLPLSPTQTAQGLLNLKRGFSKENIGNWNPETKPGVTGTARRAYGSLDNEFDQAVPDAAALNQRISSLIPVTQRGESLSRGAPFMQRVGNRVAARTGALIGAAGGYAAGGIPGGIVGLLGPELVADPAAQMAAARSLDWLSKSPNRSTPLPYWVQGLLGNVTQMGNKP